MKNEVLRLKHMVRMLPPVHELQRTPQFNDIANRYEVDKKTISDILKSILIDIREKLLSEQWKGYNPGTQDFIEEIMQAVEASVEKKVSYRLKKVINATGTVLHTNLGRARLSERAIRHVVAAAQNYSNLEYTTSTGERGSRHTIIENWIKEITGAEAAMVVNNNAAAVYLILRALAKEKEVIVSRGQLVEIGGSFRISSIMEESGAILKEVGTTNKTHLYDYENAISDETAMIMKVHTSNFQVIGFTESVESKNLIGVAKRENLIFYEDLGSGVLYDFKDHQIGDEPLVKDVLDNDADIVSFSGDKLLGGPQAGIIAGKKKYIDILKKHQLARVLRVDKMTLAALEATLADYMKGIQAATDIPTIRDIIQTKEEIEHKAAKLLRFCMDSSDTMEMRIAEGTSMIGGGTMPGVSLPTSTVIVKITDFTASQIHERLRTGFPSVVGRIHDNDFILDMRTVSNEELEDLSYALKKVAEKPAND